MKHINLHIQLLLLLFTLVVTSSDVMAQGDANEANRSNSISRNWYRIPYILNTLDSGQYLVVNANNVRQNNHNGVDISGVPDADDDLVISDCNPFDGDVGLEVVAARDGIVRTVVDTNKYRSIRDSTCAVLTPVRNNRIWIEHDNNEWSAYYHLAYKSAKVVPGQFVTSGTVIADEGETGRASDVHLHFAVYDGYLGNDYPGIQPEDFERQRIPMLCGKNNLHTFEVSEKYAGTKAYEFFGHELFFDLFDGVIGECGIVEPVSNTTIAIANETYVNIERAVGNITAIDVTIEPPAYPDTLAIGGCPAMHWRTGTRCRNNGGSVVLSAGKNVLLKAGFHAKAGSFFRAELDKLINQN